MATLQEIMLRAQLLREETAVDSISPERAGGIMYDTLAYINQMQLQAANPLLISKIYASVAAMEADSAPVSDLTGEPLRPGQVVVIATGDPDDLDEGVVYRYDGTESSVSSWTAVGKIGNVEPVDSLDSDSTQLPLAAHQGKVLDSKITELGQGYQPSECPQYVYAIVDKDKKVLYAIQSNGQHLFFGKVNAPDGLSSPEIEAINGIISKTENPEYADVVVDKSGKIIEALRSDGLKEIFVPVLFSGGVKGIDIPQPSQGSTSSKLSGKSIAWYGTSIPAGSNFPISITGSPVKAKLSGFSDANTLRIFTEQDNLPSEYPIIAASLAGAKTIYNEAVGSSRAVRNTSDARLLVRCKALGNTVQEICSYIWGSYNIDIANRTFEENHENTIGITTFLTTAGTWSSFVNNVFMILRYSYQICIVACYLCENKTQWQEYIEDVFGVYYDDVVALLESNDYSMERLAGYVGADMFILEHSVNDGGSLFTGDVESSDVNTFEGAYNLFINTILRYKPSARIAIVSNYAPLASEIQYNKIKSTYLQAIADRWHIPFLDMAEYSQVVLFNVRTQGHWDSEQVWHNSGFTWVPDSDHDTYTTNCNFPTALSDPSLAAMQSLVDPQQVDGVWTWEASDLYIWMWDGLHPHSDNSGRLTILLGKVLAEFLERVSVI